MASPRFRRRLIWAQAVVVPTGSAILFYVLVDALPFVRLDEVLDALVVSFVPALAGYALFSVRLAAVLRSFRVRIPARSVCHIHLTSLFYYVFLPASLGYDVSKIAKIAARVPSQRPRRITLMTLVERATGGLGALVLLLAAVPLTRAPERGYLAWLNTPVVAHAAGVAVAIATALFVGLHLRRGANVNGRLLVPPVAVSALAYLLIALGVWTIARALDLPVGLAEIIVAMAGTLLFQLVPLNVAGVSAGDVAASAIYLGYGLDQHQALLLVTAAYVHRLGAALLGGGLESVQALRRLRQSHATEPPRGESW